jgi:uncharacterized protein YbbC (DUF1343 family)
VQKGGIDLTLLVETYRALLARGEKFFVSSFFERLVGVDYVRDMIVQGYSAEEIENMWQEDVEAFRRQREKYLIYEE